MVNKKVIYLLAVIVAGVIISAFLWYLIKPIPKKQIKAEIKRFYELLIPGASVEVISLTEESGLYRAVIKFFVGGQVSYGEAFVTKDGEIITENVVYLKRSAEQIARMKAFVDCLANNGVRIFGMLNTTASPQGAQATILQLNLLGRYSWTLYQSCDGEALQACINAGITQVPSVVIGRKIEPGVKTVSWFEQQTNCKY